MNRYKISYYIIARASRFAPLRGGVRVLDTETGLAVRCHSNRSDHKNFAACMKYLYAATGTRIDDTVHSQRHVLGSYS